MGGKADAFAEHLDAVSNGQRRLDEIEDPVVREAVATALGLRQRDATLAAPNRARLRRSVLANVPSRRPGLVERAAAAFAGLFRR
ncbi:MAG TPA: hypothetical protein VF998_10550 [Candidatus Limnocylindria bacterium]